MKLFVTDLDGTFLNSNAEVSDYTINTVNKLIEKGMNFTAATARTLASAGKILKDINLRLPLILMNGVLIFNPLTKKYEVVNKLDETLCKIVCEEKDKLGLDGFMYTIKDDSMMTYFENLSTKAMNDFYDERRFKYYKSFVKVESFSDIKSDKIYFTFINTYEKIFPLYERLKQNKEIGLTFYRDIYSDDLWYCEVFSVKASKKNAVLWLRDKYGFDFVTGFGDNLNDLPMFEACDKRVAVENAKDKVKEKSDEITGSNNDNGVAKYLERQELK